MTTTRSIIVCQLRRTRAAHRVAPDEPHVDEPEERRAREELAREDDEHREVKAVERDAAGRLARVGQRAFELEHERERRCDGDGAHEDDRGRALEHAQHLVTTVSVCVLGSHQDHPVIASSRRPDKCTATPSNGVRARALAPEHTCAAHHLGPSAVCRNNRIIQRRLRTTPTRNGQRACSRARGARSTSTRAGLAAGCLPLCHHGITHWAGM